MLPDSTTHVIIDVLTMFSHVSLTHAGVGCLIVGPCWPWTDVFSLHHLWCISYIYPHASHGHVMIELRLRFAMENIK